MLCITGDADCHVASLLAMTAYFYQSFCFSRAVIRRGRRGHNPALQSEITDCG